MVINNIIDLKTFNYYVITVIIFKLETYLQVTPASSNSTVWTTQYRVI